MDRTLRCRLYHFNDNYLRMGPFKVEEKSERPMAVVFHDFMTKSETKVKTQESQLQLNTVDLKCNSNNTGSVFCLDLQGC